ncbi:MAG: DUF4177 domain-containing protein [bacterium]
MAVIHTSFEYKVRVFLAENYDYTMLNDVFYKDIQDELNKMGKEGWELVSFLVLTEVNALPEGYVCTLKRALN